MNKNWPWAYFTDQFSIIDWNSLEVLFAFFKMVTKLEPQNFAHDTTGKISWHRPKFVIIRYLEMKLYQSEIPTEFQLQWKSQ